MILEETPDRVKVIENPLAKAEPMVLKTSEIVERAEVARRRSCPRACSTS